jgi:glutamate/tyrosine decarboxylase-like PLP-dependent enzyme
MCSDKKFLKLGMEESQVAVIHTMSIWLMETTTLSSSILEAIERTLEMRRLGRQRLIGAGVFFKGVKPTAFTWYSFHYVNISAIKYVSTMERQIIVHCDSASG